MTELASRGQLRAGFLRWALVLVPGVILLGFLSGAVAQSGPGNPWFDGLSKPALYPPPQLFGIVWSALYVMMGVALAMVVAARAEATIAMLIGSWVGRGRLEAKLDMGEKQFWGEQ